MMGGPDQVLETHQDEVWHVQFSHSGTMLASASKDATSLIWRVSPAGEALLMHTLAGHSTPVVFLTWSPDDCRLLTCCANQEASTLYLGGCHVLAAHCHRSPCVYCANAQADTCYTRIYRLSWRHDCCAPLGAVGFLTLEYPWEVCMLSRVAT